MATREVIMKTSKMVPYGVMSTPAIVIDQMRYELQVVADEPTARVDLLHRNIQKFGTITDTLSRACDVTGVVTAMASLSKP